jgi:diguanylate cyclase (GGDEF)-like protein
MENADFHRAVLDSLREQIVVIDRKGLIRFVNEAWVRFGEQNGCKTNPREWTNVNYLDVCDFSGRRGEKFGLDAARGITKVINGELDHFDIEYPCHSPQEKRWFVMSVTSLQTAGANHFAISHQNITARKIAEDLVRDLSRMDGLTGVPNRRYFDQFLADEWNRCSRLQLPLSVAIMDIDHFKVLNDQYGHPAGDECLIRIGNVFNMMKKRPGDLFARYGGEEFAFVFGNTTTEQALIPINKIVDSIRNLRIPNHAPSEYRFVTVSVGLATGSDGSKDEKALMKEADVKLYQAKHDGRDRVVF